MKRKTILCLAAAVLVVALALSLWWPVIFQRGNPMPYLLAISQLSKKRPYVLVEKIRGPEPHIPGTNVYITKRGDCPELFALIEANCHATFEEQVGSSFVFKTRPTGDWWFVDGLESVTVSSEIYWRYFTVWMVPSRIRCIS